jgi:hypothetical protein
MVWLIGRTYTAGKRDYDAVHAIQREYKLAPPARVGEDGRGARRCRDADDVDGEPPVAQVDKLAAAPILRAAGAPDEGQPAGRRRRAAGTPAGACWESPPASRSIWRGCLPRSSTPSRAASRRRARGFAARARTRWARS